LPARTRVLLAKDTTTMTGLKLEPDVPQPRSAAYVVDVRVGALFAFGLGGDVTKSCTDACTSPLPFGGLASVAVGYELPSSIRIALVLGYGIARTAARGRPRELRARPTGTPSENGTVDDEVVLRAGRLGGELTFRVFGARPAVRAGVGAGVLTGTLTDTRTGTFGPPAGPSHPTDRRGESSETTGLYVGPALSAVLPLGRHLALAALVELWVIADLSRPAWEDRTDVTSPTLGFATYGRESLARPVSFTLAPSVVASWTF
jgi:hypothetical protein